MLNLEILASPIDGSNLIKKGKYLIIDKNGNEFSLINGIPRFVNSDNYASSFGKQWNYFKKNSVR